jgi:hypothetical protein
MPRALRVALLVVAGLAAAALLALALSAALDRPARIVSASTELRVRKPEAWAVLTDFAGYRDWNPFIVRAAGEAEEGAVLRLEAAVPGHGRQSLDATVLVAHPDRKLRWQDRLVLPGLRDWEYEFVLEPLGDGRTLLVQQLRVEGLLAPFADTDALREALERSGEALQERLDAGP